MASGRLTAFPISNQFSQLNPVNILGLTRHRFSVKGGVVVLFLGFRGKYSLDIKQEPSTDTFFLRLEEGKRSEVNQLLAPLGALEDLPVNGGMRLRVAGSPQAPRDAWQGVQALLGERATVQPVLLDKNGYEQYPTGEISVRFLDAPSDQQLKQFAESYGLRPDRRNEYVPEQAVFTPLEPGRRYLPDLVREISSDSSVQAAWANTLAQYRRA